MTYRGFDFLSVVINLLLVTTSTNTKFIQENKPEIIDILTQRISHLCTLGKGGGVTVLSNNMAAV